ncbi:MAG: MoaD/ThiS family protein [Methylovulum sp.]|jgi:molybdopterin synthase sulfur carrier subunit|nr:MoaD/ThiS family protein [Methylovulum sp.]MCF7998990.1 MoaD/ThiS family protein [Methylovulum sp.]
MSVKVRYFASLRERLGRSEDELVFFAPLTAHAIWERANPDLPMPDNTLVAVNMDYVKLDVLVNDGDEIAFFPPVTGG